MFLNQTELNNKTWQITRKYAEAKRTGFLIEATVLFNYMLRHKLLIIINSKLVEKKSCSKKNI